MMNTNFSKLSTVKIASVTEHNNHNNQNTNDLTQLALQFSKAQQVVKTLQQRPSNQQLLQLYALYKQAEYGDASAADKPRGFNMVAVAKYDAWQQLAGVSQQHAQQDYIRLVQQLMN